MESIRLRSFPWPVALTAVVLMVLVVAGCGSSSSGGGSSSSASPSGTAVTIAGVSITADPALNALLPANIKSRGELRVASALPYEPWEYFDPPTSKNPAGFDFDLSQAIGAKLGIKAPFLNTPFDSIIVSVKGGKNDMIMADMYDNTDREKELSFVDYAYDGTSILVAKGNPQGLSNLDSLSGKTIAVLSGSSQQALLEKLNKTFKSSGKPAISILSLPGTPDGLLAIQGGRAAALVTDHSQAVAVAKSTSGGTVYEVLQDPAAPRGYEPAIVGIGIDKNNPQLVTAVQKALQALIDEGAYQKIIGKYGLTPVTKALVDQAGAAAASASPSP